jgi:hypothetical protein
MVTHSYCVRGRVRCWAENGTGWHYMVCASGCGCVVIPWTSVPEKVPAGDWLGRGRESEKGSELAALGSRFKMLGSGILITNPVISVLMKRGEEGAAGASVADYNNGEGWQVLKLPALP